MNRGKLGNNTSGYKGVTFNKLTQRWRAQIAKDKKSIYLGEYDTPELAFAAYTGAAKALHGEFAKLK
jgi:hypothetical protein